MKPIIYQLFVRLFSNRNTKNAPFGSLAENGCGKFNDLNHNILTEIKSLGITHIWLTGVLRHASQTAYPGEGLTASHPSIVKGIAGSPYAIRDYYDVDPDLAFSVDKRMEEFENLVQRIHQHGMLVIIDFVPNHVSRDYGSKTIDSPDEDLGAQDNTTWAFKPENNFYYLPGESLVLPDQNTHPEGPYLEFPARVTGNDVFRANPGLYDWYETIKINYGFDYLNQRAHFDPIPSTWVKMTRILDFWASKGIDGFRCDMAGMVPVSFWSYAIQKIKQTYPDIRFLAEIYEPHRYREFIEMAGFDWLYDKVGLYDTLRNVIQWRHPAEELSLVWQRLEGLDPYMLRFIENHDEQRVASPHFCGDAMPGLAAFAVCAFMHQGPLMIYNGQEFGEAAREILGFSGDDGRTSIFDYGCMTSVSNWISTIEKAGYHQSVTEPSVLSGYRRILQALKQYRVFSEGGFYDLMWYNRAMPGFHHIYTFLRYMTIADADDGKQKSTALIAVNFSSELQTSKIRIPEDALIICGIGEAERIILSNVTEPITINGTRLPSQLISSGIEVSIQPWDYAIIAIEAG